MATMAMSISIPLTMMDIDGTIDFTPNFAPPASIDNYPIPR